MNKNLVFLNGFMGAGKSKIGPIVADKLNCPFFDSDKIIEEATGKTISDIFTDQGEETFRKMEQAILFQLIGNNNKAVIALGGGALMNPDNKKMADKKGTVVYIKSSPEEIFKRVKKTSKRPLLNIPRDENFETNLLIRIEELLKDRKDVYESAAVIIERDGFDPPQVAEMILTELEQFGKKT
ncbi:MAG: shikimate kinase [Calditrichaeota bacterium]|nr:shikimate kinase [Calditrichota bacterium]